MLAEILYAMKILIFDTETSGLNPGWNVILQLSYQIVDTETWYSDKVVNHYFPWPENKYRVSEEAICVNGLSEEFLATQQLSDRKTALEEFVADKDACDLLVAHNLEFDKKFIIESCREEGVKFASSGWAQSYDTMKRTTNFCQIPKGWGNGYKWPKLTELADCLGINYSCITLHDSSGDVELTKLCFRELLCQGIYHLPRETGMTISLHVYGPDNLSFILKDEYGEAFSDRLIEQHITKKELNIAKQEAIKQWSESNEEERNDLVQIYCNSPQLKTKEHFKADIEALKPEEYTKQAFEEPAPSKSSLRESLEQEANENVSSWKFWALKKLRQEYVETRLEPLFQEQTEAYNKRRAQHEESENKAEAEFNQRSVKQCEERKKQLTALIEGAGVELLEQEMQGVPDAMNCSLPYNIIAHAKDGTTISIDLTLPQPSDMPQVEGVRLSSGNFKIKDIPAKDKKEDYSNFIFSFAIYVASHYFNVSPLIENVNIVGHVPLDNEDIPLYNVSFDRTKFCTLNFEETDLKTVLSNFPLTNCITKDTLAKLFVKKEREVKSTIEEKPTLVLDPIFEDAARFIVQSQNGGAANIQRKFEIGYNRAGRLMEQLERMGIVGPARGASPREVLIKDEEELTRILYGNEEKR